MGARPDYPEFIAATLPSPLQWEGRTIWRVDLKAYQFSNGVAWLTQPHQDPTTGALVGAGGQEIAAAVRHGDQLRTAGSLSPIATAISTTAVVAAAIPVQATRVRVAWNGRGSAGAASGTARLNIACNRSNDTQGLVAGQDDRRRDAQLAAGEAVILLCASPITTLHFSANESVSVNTHGIQVSYEV